MIKRLLENADVQFYEGVSTIAVIAPFPDCLKAWFYFEKQRLVRVIFLSGMSQPIK